MPADKSDKPFRTIQLETGMAMTLSCNAAREPKPLPLRPAPAAPSQQRETAK